MSTVPCREVRKAILSLPGSRGDEIPDGVSEHLAACEACRKLRGIAWKIDGLFADERLRLSEKAVDGEPGKRRVLTELVKRRQRKQSPRLRAAWAGAAVAVLLLCAISVRHFLKPEEKESGPGRGIAVAWPKVTQDLAADHSFKTLKALGDLVHRHRAPSFELPYARPETASLSLLPPLLQECSVESRNTLHTIMQSKANFIERRNAI
jgi:hypothetical protein